MTTINITPVGSEIPVAIDKKAFLGALENCDPVNNIITIKGKQYTLNSVEFGTGGSGAITQKVYRALLSQNGSDSPEVLRMNEADADYLGDISWLRQSNGYYVGTRAGAFPDNSVFVMVGQNATSDQVIGTDVAEGDINHIKLITSKIVSGSNRVAKLDKTTGTNQVFNAAGFNNSVFCATKDANGKIIVGGAFSTYDGTPVSKIARINTDGTLDESFITGTGFDGNVLAIAVLSGGDIIVGGNFTQYNGVAVNYVVRLSSTGVLDAGFTTNIGTASGNSLISFIKIDTRDRILIGGQFLSFNGNGKLGFVRVLGTGMPDPTFTFGLMAGGFNGYAYAAHIYPTGEILLGGNFQVYDGVSANCIIRLTATGLVDATFDYGCGFEIPMFGFGLNGVISLAVSGSTTAGKILVGGGFVSYNHVTPLGAFGGTLANNIIMLNATGEYDAMFITNAGTGINKTCTLAIIDSYGDYYISFDGTPTPPTYNGLGIPELAKINNAGMAIPTFSPDISMFGVKAVIPSEPQEIGKVYALGLFTAALSGIHSDNILNKTPIEIRVKQS